MAVGLAFVVLVVIVVTHLRRERPRQAWLWPLLGGLAALLVMTAFQAVSDAYVLRHNNCWVVAELEQSDGAWSVWDCAPGRHDPHEYEELDYDGFDVVGGRSRTCDYHDEIQISTGDVPFELSAGDTARVRELPEGDYWLCEESDF